MGGWAGSGMEPLLGFRPSCQAASSFFWLGAGSEKGDFFYFRRRGKIRKNRMEGNGEKGGSTG